MKESKTIITYFCLSNSHISLQQNEEQCRRCV